MPIEFYCTECGQPLKVADDAAGKAAKCPSCGTNLKIPAASSPAPGSPAPAGPAPSANPFGGFAPPSANPGNVNPFQSPGAYQASNEPQPTGEIRLSPLDLGDAMGRTWDLYKANLGICIGVSVIALIINYAVSFAGSMVTGIAQGAVRNNIVAFVAVQLVVFVIQMVAQLWLGAGQTNFFLKIARRQTAEITDLFSGGPFLVPILLTTLLLSIVGSAIFLLPGGITYLITRNQDTAFAVVGLFMLVGGIPAIIVGLMLSQYQFLIIDRRAGVIESLELSRQVTSGNKLSLLGLFLVAGLMNLGGMLACCIGLIFTIPYGLLALAMAYLMMTGQLPPPPQVGAPIQAANPFQQPR